MVPRPLYIRDQNLLPSRPAKKQNKTITQIKIWIAILTPNFKEYNLTGNGKPSHSSERMVNNIFVHKIFLIFLVL